MNRILCKIFKKIIISFLIINSFNAICSNYLVFIPINVVTITSTVIFGIPGLLAIIILSGVL